MERSRLREGSSLSDHILIRKPLCYRSGSWTLLPLTTLWAFFTICLPIECLYLTHHPWKLFSALKGELKWQVCVRTRFHTTEAKLLKTYNWAAVLFKTFTTWEPSNQYLVYQRDNCLTKGNRSQMNFNTPQKKRLVRADLHMGHALGDTEEVYVIWLPWRWVQHKSLNRREHVLFWSTVAIKVHVKYRTARVSCQKLTLVV